MTVTTVGPAINALSSGKTDVRPLADQLAAPTRVLLDGGCRFTPPSSH
ncbi:hypothetical protein [Amycolatopsis sp. NPDC004378]